MQGIGSLAAIAAGIVVVFLFSYSGLFRLDSGLQPRFRGLGFVFSLTWLVCDSAVLTHKLWQR